MKTYTTKANANRAAKKLSSKHAEVINEILVVPFASGYSLEISLVPGTEEIPADLAKFDTCCTAPEFMEPEITEKDQKHHEAVTGEKPETAGILRKSSTESPCTVVWNIADQMEGSRRKDVLAACVDAGVAYYTARTQYQHWKTAMAAGK